MATQGDSWHAIQQLAPGQVGRPGVVGFSDLSDAELTDTVKRLATHERKATGTLIRSLMEVDARRLFLRAGCSSLFAWCTEVIGLADSAAYNRIEVARAAQRVPQLLEALDDGSLNLTTARVLAPHITPANADELIGRARHKSRREVERIIAEWNPIPEAPCTVNYLSPGWVRVHLTLPEATYDKLRLAVDLLRHTNPSGQMADVIGKAVTLLVHHLERRKFAATKSPRKAAALRRRTRYIPAAIKRAVWARDGGQCAYVGTEGRCTSKAFLEYHHLEPYGAGGKTTVKNVEMRCRQHNQYEADVYYGGGERPAGEG